MLFLKTAFFERKLKVGICLHLVAKELDNFRLEALYRLPFHVYNRII